MVKKLKGPSEDTSVPLGRRSSNLKRSDGGMIRVGKKAWRGRVKNYHVLGGRNMTEALRTSKKNGNREPLEVGGE